MLSSYFHNYVGMCRDVWTCVEDDDRYMINLPMSLAAGDRIQILGTGAYTTTCASNGFNGFAPLKDVDKSRVWALARWRNQAALDAGELPPIPESSITKPPSAELSPAVQRASFGSSAWSSCPSSPACWPTVTMSACLPATKTTRLTLLWTVVYANSVAMMVPEIRYCSPEQTSATSK